VQQNDFKFLEIKFVISDADELFRVWFAKALHSFIVSQKTAMSSLAASIYKNPKRVESIKDWSKSYVHICQKISSEDDSKWR